MEWRKVGGFPIYSVSEDAQIRNDRTCRIIKPRYDKNGYLTVTLYNRELSKYKTKKVHRLFAIAYIPNPENKPVINHINGIRDDNRLSNLEWVTIAENNRHAFKVLDCTERLKHMSEGRKGKKAGIEASNKRAVIRIEDGKFYPLSKWAAEELNVGRTSITNSIKRGTSCRGYHFMYAEV